MNPNAQVYLLGSGVLSFLDITLYTQQILRRCRTVFYLHDMPTLDRFLKELTPNPVNLMPVFYLEGRERIEIYRDVAARVIAGAESESPVALLTHGHPLVYSTIAELLLEGCEERGIPVEVVPAVSSLDRMFVDLRLDIATRGLQVLSAAAAIRDDIRPNPELDCIFFQIANVLSPLATRESETLPEQVTPLKDLLLRVHPPEHVVQVVESAVELGYTTRITPCEIERLEEVAASMNYTASLYVPGRSRGADGS